MARAKAVKQPDGVQTQVPRIMVPLDSVHEDMANSNVHDDADVTSIMAKLATFGQVEPLVVQASTRKVIGGNGRLHAMRRLGWTECWVNLEECDNVTATAMGIALNTRKSHFDEPTLVKHLRALQSESFNLASTGFEDEEVDAMCERLARQISSGVEFDGGGDPAGVGPGLDGDFEIPPSQVRMVQLFLTNATFPAFREAVDALSREYGLSNDTDTVMECLRRAANRIEQPDAR